MIIHTFGKNSDPVFVILHPPGLSGNELYQRLQPYLRGNYYIIAPDLRGHGEDQSDYISPENDGKTLLRYLKEKRIRNIRILFGMSVGAAAALRILGDPGLHIDHIFLDSTPLISRSAVKQSILTASFLKEKKRSNKNPDSMKMDLEKMYGRDLAPILLKNILKYSDRSLKNICAAFFSNSSIRSIPKDIQRKMIMEWGGNDIVFKESEHNIRKNFPHAKILLHRGEGHCSYMAKNTDRYVERIEKSRRQ